MTDSAWDEPVVIGDAPYTLREVRAYAGAIAVDTGMPDYARGMAVTIVYLIDRLVAALG